MLIGRSSNMEEVCTREEVMEVHVLSNSHLSIRGKEIPCINSLSVVLHCLLANGLSFQMTF